MWTDSSLATPLLGLSSWPQLDRERLVSEKGLGRPHLVWLWAQEQHRKGHHQGRIMAIAVDSFMADAV